METATSPYPLVTLLSANPFLAPGTEVQTIFGDAIATSGTSYSLAPLDHWREFERVWEEISNCGRGVRVRMVCATTRATARRALAESHVVVLGAHGTINGAIALEDEFGGVDYVSPEDWSELVSRQQAPKLVLLSACHSEETGRVLVRSGVRRVIAIRDDKGVQNIVSEYFTATLLRHLVLGASSEIAFRAALDVVTTLPQLSEESRSRQEHKFVALPEGEEADPGRLGREFPLGDAAPRKAPLRLSPPLSLRLQDFPRPVPRLLGRNDEVREVVHSLLDPSVDVVFVANREPGMGTTSVAVAACDFLVERNRVDWFVSNVSPSVVEGLLQNHFGSKHGQKRQQQRRAQEIADWDGLSRVHLWFADNTNNRNRSVSMQDALAEMTRLKLSGLCSNLKLLYVCSGTLPPALPITSPLKSRTVIVKPLSPSDAFNMIKCLALEKPELGRMPSDEELRAIVAAAQGVPGRLKGRLMDRPVPPMQHGALYAEPSDDVELGFSSLAVAADPSRAALHTCRRVYDMLRAANAWTKEADACLRKEFHDAVYASANLVSARGQTPRALSPSDLDALHARARLASELNPARPTLEAVVNFWKLHLQPIVTLISRVADAWHTGLILGIMSSSRAEEILRDAEPGTFLLRPSESAPGVLSASYVTRARVVRSALVNVYEDGRVAALQLKRDGFRQDLVCERLTKLVRWNDAWTKVVARRVAHTGGLVVQGDDESAREILDKRVAFRDASEMTTSTGSC